MSLKYIQSPGGARYPLTAKEALVTAGESIAVDQSLYIFTMADGRDILIKSPLAGTAGDHILPAGTVLAAQTPFIGIRPVEAAPQPAAPPETPRASPPPEPQTEPQPAAAPRKPAKDKPKPNRALSMLIAALTPLILIGIMVWLRDFRFHDAFQEDWSFVAQMLIGLAVGLAAFKLSTVLQERLAGRVDHGTVSTCFGIILPFLMLFPAGTYLDILDDMGIDLGPTPGRYQPPAPDAPPESLARYSNGTTPTPSPQVVEAYQRWLNE